MAVVMTTKFYEEDTPAWHDLSKVVFTSPNMDSPNAAGTRSHILPGQLDLGMWYEDTSNMYKIEYRQETDVSTYFGYSAQIYDQFDMGDPPLYITIDQTDQGDWIEYVRERVDEAGGSWPIKYQLITGNYGDISFDGATFSGGGGVFEPELVITEEGYYSETEFRYIYITFPVGFYPLKIEFGCLPDYFTYIWKLTKYDSTILMQTIHSDSVSVESFDIPLNYHDELLDKFVFILEGHYFDNDGVSATLLKFFGYKNPSIYTVDSVTCSSGTDPINVLNTVGWSVDELETDPHWVTIGFDHPKRVTKVEFNNYEDYEIKDYKIQACATVSGTYVDLCSRRAVFDYTDLQEITFSNYIGYNYYRFYVYSRYASSVGYGIKELKLYEYAEDESVTNPITLYIDNENVINVSHANNAESTDYLFKLDIDSVNGTGGAVASGTVVYGWGQSGSSTRQVKSTNSVVFEVTTGECYDCRLTAWDDVTHSTTLNHLIATDRCRVSCLVYNSVGNILVPAENTGVSFVHPPVLNKIFKGNTVYEGENFYYGDFNMRYRTSYLGDYLIFKPMLYDIDETVSYGIHDHVIVLHYSYT